MTRRNLLLLAAIAAAGGSVLLVGQHMVAAASTTTSTSGLSNAIATQLNVSSTAVQGAIDSYQTTQEAQREADRRTQYVDKLTQAVTDGKLTADQKTKLLAEYDSVASKMSDLQKQMQQIHTDETQWATSNGIDTQWLPGGPGGPGGMRHGPGF